MKKVLSCLICLIAFNIFTAHSWNPSLNAHKIRQIIAEKDEGYHLLAFDFETSAAYRFITLDQHSNLNPNFLSAKCISQRGPREVYLTDKESAQFTYRKLKDHNGCFYYFPTFCPGEIQDLGCLDNGVELFFDCFVDLISTTHEHFIHPVTNFICSGTDALTISIANYENGGIILKPFSVNPLKRKVKHQIFSKSTQTPILDENGVCQFITFNY